MGNDVYTTGFDPFNPTGTSGGTSFYTYNNDKVNLWARRVWQNN